MQRFFATFGIAVVEASNPYAALGSMSEGPFDLVLTDINMPERSGVWLLEELRDRAPDVPVIVMTGGELKAEAVRAIVGIETPVLRKPFELAELELLLRQLVPHLADQAGTVNDDFRGSEPVALPDRPYSYASRLVGDIIARTVGLEVDGVPWRGRVHPDDQPILEKQAQAALSAGHRFRAEYRLLTVDGETIWVLHEAPVQAGQGGLPRLGAGAVIDITARKREEEWLRASEERHRFLTEHSTDMITVQSGERLVYVSPACEALLGYEPDFLLGRSPYELIHRDDVTRVRESHDEVLRSPYMYTVDYRIRRKDRRYVWFESTSRIVTHTDASLPPEIISVSRDVTERKENEERLRQLAILDDLTGLYNRRGFLALAGQHLKAARRAKRHALVLFADLNNLKQINDTLGHKDGDQAIVDAAHIFNRTFRDSDVVARVGGDEFAILAVETDHDHLDTIRSRLDSALQLANADRARPFELSISLGAATFDPVRNDSVEELLAWADKAMYEQKRSRTRLN